MCMAFRISWMYGIAIFIASGVASLLALYSGKASFLSLLPPLSKQTAKWSGRSRFITSKSEFIKPIIAEVSKPLELILGFLIKA